MNEEDEEDNLDMSSIQRRRHFQLLIVNEMRLEVTEGFWTTKSNLWVRTILQRTSKSCRDRL